MRVERKIVTVPPPSGTVCLLALKSISGHNLIEGRKMSPNALLNNLLIKIQMNYSLFAIVDS